MNTYVQNVDLVKKQMEPIKLKSELLEQKNRSTQIKLKKWTYPNYYSLGDSSVWFSVQGIDKSFIRTSF